MLGREYGVAPHWDWTPPPPIIAPAAPFESVKWFNGSPFKVQYYTALRWHEIKNFIIALVCSTLWWTEVGHFWGNLASIWFLPRRIPTLNKATPPLELLCKNCMQHWCVLHPWLFKLDSSRFNWALSCLLSNSDNQWTQGDPSISLLHCLKLPCGVGHRNVSFAHLVLC